jgi:hypothetical protein
MGCDPVFRRLTGSSEGTQHAPEEKQCDPFSILLIVAEHEPPLSPIKRRSDSSTAVVLDILGPYSKAMHMQIRPPVKWHGGKRYLAQRAMFMARA